MQILLPELRFPKINICDEYSESDDYTIMTVKYPDDLRPDDHREELPYRMLMANTESLGYTYDDAEGSTVVMRLR